MSNNTFGRWIEVKDQESHSKALGLARGSYQRAVLMGHESVSGSTLRGAARTWAGKYRASRDALLARVQAAGIAVTVTTADRGAKILIIG